VPLLLLVAAAVPLMEALGLVVLVAAVVEHNEVPLMLWQELLIQVVVAVAGLTLIRLLRLVALAFLLCE
jgi:hypothetical protein